MCLYYFHFFIHIEYTSSFTLNPITLPNVSFCKTKNTYNVILILCPRPWPTSRSDYRSPYNGMVHSFYVHILDTFSVVNTLRGFVCIWKQLRQTSCQKHFHRYIIIWSMMLLSISMDSVQMEEYIVHLEFHVIHRLGI